MSGTTVVVDGGRSGCRVATVLDGIVVRPPTTAPGLPLVALPDGPDAVAARVADAVATQPGKVEVVCAGLTGLFECMERAPDLAARIRHATGAHRVLLTGDVVTSHAGALGGRPGVVIAAGTGAVALGVAADGRWARVDGWGFVIGDAGSGFAVGRAGLDAAIRHYDGRGGSAELAARAEARYGPIDGLTSVIYAADNAAGTVAAFARDVAAAARGGDHVAHDIWLEAATQLARTAAAAARRVHDGGDVPVACTGALFHARDLIDTRFREALAEQDSPAVPIAALGDALDGAAVLATEAPPAMSRFLAVAED
jgi:glucosamine kinase